MTTELKDTNLKTSMKSWHGEVCPESISSRSAIVFCAYFTRFASWKQAQNTIRKIGWNGFNVKKQIQFNVFLKGIYLKLFLTSERNHIRSDGATISSRA